MNLAVKMAFAAVLAGLAPFAGATVVTINSDGDDGLATAGSTTCDTGNTVSVPGAGTVPECTLRAAVEVLWNVPGEGTIEYASALECSDLNVIQLESGESLPAFRDRVTIIAETHPCYNDGSEDHFPLVFMPASAGSTDFGLQVEGDDSVIDSMAFSGFDVAGIRVNGASGAQLRNIESSFNAVYGVIIEDVSGAVLEDSTIESQIPDNANNVGLFDSNNVVIRNNLIRNAGQHGIFIGPGSHSNTIGSVVGTAPNQFCAGNEIRDNGDTGIITGSSGGNNTIQCNAITDNDTDGIRLASEGNLIGSGQDIGSPDLILRGNQVQGNGWVGIRIDEGSEDNTIARNLIGGSEGDPDDGNGQQGILVSGGIDGANYIRENSIRYNEFDGIRLQDEGRAVIQGNYIASNLFNGIMSDRNFVTIGGEEDGEGNVIVLNEAHGISLFTPEGPGFPGIAGNHVGTDEDGAELGNEGYGIRVAGALGSVNIGNLPGSQQGSAPNVIGFNGDGGIQASNSGDVRILKNYIGTNASGMDLGNNAAGVRMMGPGGSGGQVGHQANTVIEPPIEGAGNIIAFNAGPGVELEEGSDPDSTSEVPIRGNSIHSNSGRGIDLGPGGDEVDPGGGQTGPNQLQNFPEMIDGDTFYNDGTGEVEFSYRVRTNTGNASYPLRVDFYLVDGTDPQGKTWIGSDSYPAGSANNYHSGSFEPAAWAGTIEGHITATATDDDGNTSEFNPDPVSLSEVDQGDEIFHDRFEINGAGGECAGNCGGMADSGCFCDEDCEGFGDCCDDVCLDCPELSHCENPDAGHFDGMMDEPDPDHSAVRPRRPDAPGLAP